jgi:hypothetical protein
MVSDKFLSAAGEFIYLFKKSAVIDFIKSFTEIKKK